MVNGFTVLENWGVFVLFSFTYLFSGVMNRICKRLLKKNKYGSVKNFLITIKIILIGIGSTSKSKNARERWKPYFSFS